MATILPKFLSDREADEKESFPQVELFREGGWSWGLMMVIE
jgi:hypothetical protein